MRAILTAQAGVPLEDKSAVNRGYAKLRKYLKDHLTLMIQNGLVVKEKFAVQEQPPLILDKIWIEVEVDVPNEYLGSAQQYCAAKKIGFKFKL